MGRARQFEVENGGTSGGGSMAAHVFRRYPYAIVVLDAEGRMVEGNERVRRVLPAQMAPGREHEPGFGCELIGCRRPRGPLEEVCLHELALDNDGPVPEVRVDLQVASGAAAAWVTVAALGTDPQRIVMELRPGRARDRRRRSETPLRAGPDLQVRALGRTRVIGPDGPINGSWLDNRAGQIFKLLVAKRRQPVYADEIVEALWPDAKGSDTRGLRYFIHVLRGSLEPGRAARSPSSYVLAAAGSSYMLDLSRVWIDATAFEEHVEAGLAARKRGERDLAADRIRRGLDLYAGDFLADEPYAEWAVGERDRLRRIASEGLRALGELGLQDGDLKSATGAFLQLAELDPFDLDVHRQLLSLLLDQGRRSDAVRHHDVLRRRMLTTFGEPLDFTLMELGS
ncbi:MAG: winged helix-turn-helix domain-containing protein [Actinomycetota bacterium]|nr:winged helix-turn-helix domain-containing protein [Actinomycetota bacterium]